MDLIEMQKLDANRYGVLLKCTVRGCSGWGKKSNQPNDTNIAWLDLKNGMLKDTATTKKPRSG